MFISMYNNTNTPGFADPRLGWRPPGANWSSTLTLETPRDTSLEMQGRLELLSPTSLQMLSSTLRAGLSQCQHTYLTNRMDFAPKGTLQSRLLSVILVVGFRPRGWRASSENSSRLTPLLITDRELGQG